MRYKQPPTVTYIAPPLQEPKKNDNSMIGSIISAGSNIVGGVIDSLLQRKENQRNREYQIAENEKNRQFTEDMYNKYESPQAQAQQMSSSGLNPAAQGAVSTQSVGSASTGSIPAGQSPAIGASIAQAGQAIIQGQMMKAQLEKMTQETQGIYQDNLRKQFENSNAQAVYDMNMDTLRQELKLKQISYDEYIERVNLLKLEYKQALAADNAGINPHVDAHNLNVAQINKIQSETETINQLREHQINSLKLSNSEIAQRTENLKKEYDILSEQATQMSDASIISGIQTQLSQFFGADISQLIPSLQYKAAEYYRDYIFGDKTYESTINAFNMQVSRILEKDGHITESSSSSSTRPSFGFSATILKQSFGLNVGGASQSHSYSK